MVYADIFSKKLVEFEKFNLEQLNFRKPTVRRIASGRDTPASPQITRRTETDGLFGLLRCHHA